MCCGLKPCITHVLLVSAHPSLCSETEEVVLTKLSGFLSKLFSLAITTNQPTRLGLTAAQLAIDVVVEFASRGPETGTDEDVLLQAILPQLLQLVKHVAHNWYSTSRRGPFIVVAHDDLVDEIQEVSAGTINRCHR